MKKIKLTLLAAVLGAAVSVTGCSAAAKAPSNDYVRTETVIVEKIVTPEPETIVQTVYVYPEQQKQRRMPYNRKSTEELFNIVNSNRNDYYKIEQIDYLLSAGADINALNTAAGMTPLIAAVVTGRSEVVKALLNRDADANIRSQRGVSALGFAVRQNNLATVRVLLSYGADIGERNLLPDSVMERDTAVLEYLISKRITAKVTRTELNDAMLKAGLLGNTAAARILINAGADTAATDNNGRGLIYYAAERGDLAALEYAISVNGNMVDLADNNGVTPLMVIVRSGNIKVVQVLVSRGACVTRQDKNKRDVISYAGNAEVRNYLRKEIDRQKPNHPAPPAKRDDPKDQHKNDDRRNVPAKPQPPVNNNGRDTKEQPKPPHNDNRDKYGNNQKPQPAPQQPAQNHDRDKKEQPKPWRNDNGYRNENGQSPQPAPQQKDKPEPPAKNNRPKDNNDKEPKKETVKPPKETVKQPERKEGFGIKKDINKEPQKVLPAPAAPQKEQSKQSLQSGAKERYNDQQNIRQSVRKEPPQKELPKQRPQERNIMPAGQQTAEITVKSEVQTKEQTLNSKQRTKEQKDMKFQDQGNKDREDAKKEDKVKEAASE